jgi:hypothetical protein
MIVGILTAGALLGGGAAGVLYLVKKKRPRLVSENIPECLGILEQVPMEGLLNQLETALDPGFIQQVKKRYLKENPKKTEDEFEWCWFELKRYFLLTSLLRKAPMFSEEVDEIWHQMILFTQKYQTFSEQFLGSMLHHTPNTTLKPEAQERAFFDWVFSQLFSITEFSWKTWGDFFKHPISNRILKEFKEQSSEWLMNKYFKVTKENEATVEYLVIQMKKQLAEVDLIQQENKKGTFPKQQTFGEMRQLSLMMVFFSYYHFDDYWTHAKVYAMANVSKYTSGCSTAVFCGHASHSHDSNHGGLEDQGSGGDSGSSCSSCGGGCSS